MSRAEGVRVPRYFVDARRSVGFATLEEARAFAAQNFPSVVLERVDTPAGPSWQEVTRFDWHWDEQAHAPAIGFS